MKPLDLIVVTPWGERLGGAEEMLMTALANLDRESLRPSVVFLGDGEFVDEVAALGFPTVVVPSGRLRHPGALARTVSRLAGVFHRRRPDLVVNWSAKAQLYSSPAAAIVGLGDRVIWWQHQIPDSHWVDRLATRLPARAIGCSSAAGADAQAELMPPRPSFVINPGIEPPEVDANGRTALRRSLGIEEGRPVVGMVGRLQPWKGQDRLLEALARLRGDGHDVHGLLVGGVAYGRSPEYASELERLVDRLGLEEAVTMTGQVPDPSPYFAAMDIAVNASEGEPFGIVLLEAMAAALPVVAVADGGPLDIVEPGVTGILAADGSPSALAAALAELLADPARRAQMGEAGRRRGRERFGARRMSEELAERFSGLVHA